MTETLALPLPILDELKPADHSLGVPLVGDVIQVGVRSVPDSFVRLAVNILPGVIVITREDGQLIQIESPFAVTTADNRWHVERRHVFNEPQSSVILRRADEPDGGWTIGTDVVAPDNRVGVARLAAKIGDTVHKRQDKL